MHWLFINNKSSAIPDKEKKYLKSMNKLFKLIEEIIFKLLNIVYFGSFVNFDYPNMKLPFLQL